MHCESCGRENPTLKDDGYTPCCNELPCYGTGSARFGTETDYVTACCWAKAEDKFIAAGREVPEGSSRLFD